MTVIVHIGRRVPRSWFRKGLTQLGGLITFQENIWLMVKSAIMMAKRKANESGKITYVVTTHNEKEDLNWQLQWIKVVIQGTEEMEKSEYDDFQKMYGPFNKIFKKELDVKKDNTQLKRFFKSKILSEQKTKEAYDVGYGAMGDNNLANKLLEMGIITHIETINDYSTRKDLIKTDF
jgi:hypothetical protein